MRLILGLIKGIVIGGLVGVGAYYLNLRGAMLWVTYGLAGAVVGLFAGRPLWSHLLDKNSTVVTPILKSAFGFGIGCGIYALVSWLAADWVVPFEFQGEQRTLYHWQPLLAGGIGALYGAFLDVDDAPPAEKPAADKK